MAGSWITLVFGDTEQPVTLKPVGLMAAERQFGPQAFTEHPVEATMTAAWVSLGKPGGDFDAWCATVDEMVTSDDGEDPTPAAPPPPSQDSLPAPA